MNKKNWAMYKGINEYKKCYQPRTYIIKKDYSNIVADTTSILSRLEQFYNLLNVYQSSRMRSGEGSTMRNFIVCTVHLIYSGWLNLED